MWTEAYYLHVEGFHEARLSPEQVKERLPDVEWLLDFTRKALEKDKTQPPHNKTQTSNRSPSKGAG